MAVLLAINRDIGRRVYAWLVESGDSPAGLLLPRQPDASAQTAAADAESHGIPVYRWSDVADDPSHVAETGADLFVSIHFPELISDAWLTAFPRGCVNLHPALLPWGRGWHTPTWAILEGTPFGATLHYIAKDVDSGAVIAQQQITVRPDHTAHSLYREALETEFELFQRTWPALRSGHLAGVPQSRGTGSFHRRADLDTEVRRLDLDAPASGRALLTRLRALTTDRWDEAAWFEEGGRRYAVRVEVAPSDES
jgi:methionyl-tRNA formyltransferase